MSCHQQTRHPKSALTELGSADARARLTLIYSHLGGSRTTVALAVDISHEGVATLYCICNGLKLK